MSHLADEMVVLEGRYHRAALAGYAKKQMGTLTRFLKGVLGILPSIIVNAAGIIDFFP